MNVKALAKKQEQTEAPARILLVDDRPTNLELLEFVLEPLEQITVRANSGEEALSHLQKEQYAVILLDVLMPGMDGIETARLIRAQRQSQDTPIIFVTASDRNEGRIRDAYSLGAVDYVFKPIIPDIIRAKVSVFVELFSAKRRLDQLLHKSKADNRSLLSVGRALLTAIPDTIFRIQRNGTYLDFIPAASSTHSLMEEQYLGKTVNDVLPRDAAGEMMKLIQRGLDEIQVQRMEWVKNEQGKQSIFEARISPCRTDEVLVIVRDITQQRLTEKQVGTAQRLEAVGRVAAGLVWLPCMASSSSAMAS